MRTHAYAHAYARAYARSYECAYARFVRAYARAYRFYARAKARYARAYVKYTRAYAWYAYARTCIRMRSCVRVAQYARKVSEISIVIMIKNSIETLLFIVFVSQKTRIMVLIRGGREIFGMNSSVLNFLKVILELYRKF